MRFATTNWKVDFRPNIVVLVRRNGRTGTPKHLTIVFRTTGKKELDVHITDGNEEKMAGTRREKHRTTVWRVDPNRYPEVTEPILRIFKRLSESQPSRRKVFRPGWLKRKGYTVYYTPEAATRAALHRLAPKLRTAYRISHDPISVLVDSMKDHTNAYCPRVLRVFGNDPGAVGMTVFAMPPGGKEGMLLTLSSERRWIGTRPGAFLKEAKKCSEELAEILRPLIRPEEIELIVKHLELETMPYLVPLVERVRRWVQRPASTVEVEAES